MRSFLLFFIIMFSVTTLVTADSNKGETYRVLGLFSEAFKKIKDNYVETVSEAQLIEAAIKGMIASLDAHSTYLSAEEYRQTKGSIQGEFGGVGIEIGKEGAHFIVVSLVKGSPAEKADIQEKDMLLAINGQLLEKKSLSEVIDLIRGRLGEKVKLKLKRGNGQPFEKTLVKERIQPHKITSQVEDGIAYIELASMQTDTTTKELKAVLGQLQKTPPRGLILDLRNNVGGLFDQAIDIANLFLSEMPIVYIQGRAHNDKKKFSAGKGAFLKDVPMIVLINGRTASSAEILAGALRDNKRAVLVGETTYGKGSVQSLLPIGGGAQALKLTTNVYITPSGKPIHGKGVVPDVVVADTSGEGKEDNVKKEAIRMLQAIRAAESLKKA